MRVGCCCECTDRQVAIAAGLEVPVNWPCGPFERHCVVELEMERPRWIEH